MKSREKKAITQEGKRGKNFADLQRGQCVCIYMIQRQGILLLNNRKGGMKGIKGKYDRRGVACRGVAPCGARREAWCGEAKA